MPPECGNPLLRDWIGEWMEKARGLQSKAYFTYKKAHDSLSKCPITFQHPSEALQLVGIGVGMVDKLEKKMIEHCKANGLPIPVRTKGKRRNPGTQEGSGTQQEESSQAAARKRPTRTYVPTYRSGAYAILLSLMDQRDNGQQQATKEQIIRCGEDYANASFDLAEPGKSYTAWNSIKTLMNKSYVWKQGSPARYMLTDQGVAMATQLRNAGIPEASQQTQSQSQSQSRKRKPVQRQEEDEEDEEEEEEESESFMEGGIDLSLYVRNPAEYMSKKSKDVPSSSLSGSPIAASSTSLPLSLSLSLSLSPQLPPQSSSSSLSASASASASRSTSSSAFLRTKSSVLSTKAMSIVIPKKVLPIEEPSTQKYRKSPDPALDRQDDYRWDESYFECLDLTEDIPSPRLPSNQPIELYSPSPPSPPQPHLSPFNYSFEEPDIVILSSPSPSPLPPSPSQHSYTPNNLRSPSFGFSEDIEKDPFETISMSVFHYTYLDTEGESVRHVGQAAFDKDDFDDSHNYHVKFLSKQKTEAIIAHIGHHQVDADNPNLLTGRIPEVHAKVICPGLPATPLLPLSREPRDEFWPSDPESSSQLFPQGNLTQSEFPSSQVTLSQLTSSQLTSSQPSSSQVAQRKYSQSQPINSTNGYSSAFDDDNDNDNYYYNNNDDDDFEDIFSFRSNMSQPQPQSQPQSQSKYEQRKQKQQESQADSNFLNECRHDPSAKFSPGSYDIVLILDNREVKMRNNRDYIQEKLAQKGVRVITRALDLGDVVWIAQKRGSDSPGDWLFLDIIIERKRLDDLISSIKDGRFHEQKKRLKESGARKVMYVVEEYNKEEAVRFGLQAIQTAMAATQVIDGFYLKRTQSIDDTIDYLVCMTRVVEKMYANTTFYRIPEHVVSRENYLKLRADYAAEAASSASSAAGQQISLEYYTISYPLYNRLNSKYGASTLKELYGRMLRTMRGVSGDKATALSQVYQTPHALFEAFEAKKGDTKAAKMLARDATSNAFMRRKWGASLSKKLWETWGVK